MHRFARTRTIQQVEIIQAQDNIWVTFRDALDVEYKLLGNVYHNPSPASLARLARVLVGLCFNLIPDGRSYIIQANRQKQIWI